jgi:3-(3-hydroxy-phenyl)propionate hydroxylase
MTTTQFDLGLHQPWLVLDLLCEADSPRVKALPRHTVQHCDPARPRTRVYIDGHRHRFELMLMPGDSEAQIQKPENFWPLVSDLLRPQDAEVERVAVYTFHSLIAECWRDERLLLAGDSCHQTPPFLGQGLCAGIRDVANLWWKLARVIRGQATPALLDSYTSERMAHVREFIELAVSIGAVIQATDGDAAAARDAQLSSGVPQLFDFPQPQLGEGIHTGESRPVACAFGQPRLSDGALLDDATGNRFALIGTACCLADLDAAAYAICESCDVVVIAAQERLSSWLSQHASVAVLLRPDHYIYGLAADVHMLGAMLAGLCVRLETVTAPATLHVPELQD